MGLRRHLRKLLSEGEEHGSYSTGIPWPSVWLFARFAYIAERYGYRYGGLDPELRGSATPWHIFHRLPDARERAERTEREFPGALRGGRLPGMYPWPVPLITKPHARREVRLLHARIKVDYFGVLGWERIRGWLIGIPVVCLIALVVNEGVDFDSPALVIAEGIAFGLVVLLALSKVFMRLRHGAYRRLLEREGVEWPPPVGQAPDR